MTPSSSAPSSQEDATRIRLSASETAERGSQDVEWRRLDFTEATQCKLEAAGHLPEDHALAIAAGTGGQRILAARMVEPGGFLLATDSSEDMLVAHVRAVACSLLRACRVTPLRDFQEASKKALAVYSRKHLLGGKAGQQTETESEHGAR